MQIWIFPFCIICLLAYAFRNLEDCNFIHLKKLEKESVPFSARKYKTLSAQSSHCNLSESCFSRELLFFGIKSLFVTLLRMNFAGDRRCNSLEWAAAFGPLHEKQEGHCLEQETAHRIGELPGWLLTLSTIRIVPVQIDVSVKVTGQGRVGADGLAIWSVEMERTGRKDKLQVYSSNGHTRSGIRSERLLDWNGWVFDRF